MSNPNSHETSTPWSYEEMEYFQAVYNVPKVVPTQSDPLSKDTRQRDIPGPRSDDDPAHTHQRGHQKVDTIVVQDIQTAEKGPAGGMLGFWPGGHAGISAALLRGLSLSLRARG